MIKQIPRQIKTIESRETKGEYGAWRREFCTRYRKLLIRTQENIYHSFAKTLAADGEKISCRKGCVHCCFHYVTVSLGHGLVIADYLYKRKELLKQFIDHHKKWQGKGYSLSNAIDRTRNQTLSSNMPIDQVIAHTRPLSSKYFEMNIPCPFLAGSTCMIYEVRPLSCAGHYSVSPNDRCAPASPQKPFIHHISPNDEDLSEMIRLADPRLILNELTLPTMLHKLLTEGSTSVLAEMDAANRCATNGEEIAS